MYWYPQQLFKAEQATADVFVCFAFLTKKTALFSLRHALVPQAMLTAERVAAGFFLQEK